MNRISNKTIIGHGAAIVDGAYAAGADASRDFHGSTGEMALRDIDGDKPSIDSFGQQSAVSCRRPVLHIRALFKTIAMVNGLLQR